MTLPRMHQILGCKEPVTKTPKATACSRSHAEKGERNTICSPRRPSRIAAPPARAADPGRPTRSPSARGPPGAAARRSGAPAGPRRGTAWAAATCSAPPTPRRARGGRWSQGGACGPTSRGTGPQTNRRGLAGGMTSQGEPG